MKTKIETENGEKKGTLLKLSMPTTLVQFLWLTISFPFAINTSFAGAA